MRATIAVGVAVVFCLGLSGCTNNQPKAEALTQQIIDEMNKLADAIEKGDKAAQTACLAKMREIAQSGKNLKITKTQEQAITAKFKPQTTAMEEKLKKSTEAALTNGKMTPQELEQLGNDLLKFEADMKAMGA